MKAGIDGITEVVGIIGYPIDYTLSPAIHNAAFCSLSLNWVYIPMRVAPDKLQPALQGLRTLGFRGANVTIPHKIAALEFIDDLRGDAELLQAVNTLSVQEGKIIGYDTDARGFTGFLGEAGIEVEGSSAMVIGAGGSARAVVLSLMREKAERIFIMNRTEGRTRELKALLKRANSDSEISERTFDYEGARVIRESSLIINCTPLGKAVDDMPPVAPEDLHEGQWVVDLKYQEAGAFLKEAAARGARTATGEGMLLHQAAASFEIWTGGTAPMAEMRKALTQAMIS
jgi:shikimate dehydrogenase